ncbi:MAG: phosphatase PAP2 family protein [Hoeflea sp.]|uniref:phosphatase PAP2 family protein n=1 Tax=Hoeflea sp. TaxID=1940281 RepID=UPI0032F078E2
MSTRDLNDIQIRFLASLGVIWAAVLIALPFTKVSIDYESFATVLVLALALAGVGMFAGRYGLDQFRGIATLMAGLFLIMLPMVTANYMAMSLNLPLADELLVRMDEAIGFDWHGFIGFFNERPLLASAFSTAYQSFLVQVALVPMLLLLLGEARRAHAFMIAYGLLTLIAAVVAIWFPAYGTYAHYGYSGAEFANINTYFGFEFIEHFEAVRNNEVFVVSTDAMSGILTFPSVHAGVAYLLIWATWSHIWLRYPFLALNLAMALAAVVNANHYFVDIIASVPLAVLCIVVVRPLFRLGARNSAEPNAASSTEPAHATNM